MNTLKINGFILIAFGMFFFNSCGDDDVVIPNEEELITTLRYTLSPTSGAPIVFSFQDLDGDGGNSPVISNGTLEANTTYNGTIELLNDAAAPAEDITVEVAEESNEHQLFYTTTASGLSIQYNDMDDNGKPLGLSTILTTGDVGENGNLTITLRHKPNKSAEGVEAGIVDNAGGETDIEVTFQVTIE